ncbi:unnamed protein product [Mytilus edulis]|uniref:B box-type domain-containing protein n=1 Tax=Mytilus edulis TaxID=6550 RepID=A0A8S3PSQ3_MYTED|nr:unnamed protein product [Mytilus edulis]
MATNESVLLCDVCQNRHLNKSAEDYCPQCEELLCRECRDHHKASKLLKSHQTITVDKYNKLPSFIKQISHNCEEHDYFLEFYCKSHDALCCKLCLISGHKECKETIFIEDFLKPLTGHQSAALDNIEKVLQDLQNNICSAIKDRNRNLNELREQKRVIGEQIKEKRKEINTLLDHLEEELLEKVSALEKTNCRKIEEIITKLEDEKEKVEGIQKDVESVKMFASDLQIFMGTKAFQESISTNEINVQQVYDNGSLNNVTMKCTFNEKLEGFIKHIKTFGDVEIDNNEKHVSFSWKGDISAQIFKPKSVAKSIETINVRLERKITIDCDGLSGCAVSESGHMLFLQAYSNRMMKYTPHGEFISESPINPEASGIGYDLEVIDSYTVAVSSGGIDHNINLIDMDSAKLRQVFNSGDYSYGLSHHNGSFICCTYVKGIKIYDKSNQNFRLLPNAPLHVGYTYVTSNENFIFHSNYHDNSVVCYDYNGQIQWKYSDSLLRKPYGITLDSNSNIYVAGFDSNNIVVISPDGKQAKELIGFSDGLSNPGAIHFDKTQNLLLVANYNKAAFLFRV